jgi:uncharacterized membrane protein YcaP (DUF421 family)
MGTMWNELMHLPISVPDKIIRTLAVYLLLAILLRVVGKRDLAQLNAFDLVVMLLLSNVVQNAIIGPDNSLLGGAIGAVVLLAANGFMNRLVRGNDRFARLVEGSPTVLARDGRWDEEALRVEGLRRAEVDAALRGQNANNVEETSLVTIEPGGSIVATLKPSEESATAADVARLEAKLDAILAQLGGAAAS